MVKTCICSSLAGSVLTIPRRRQRSRRGPSIDRPTALSMSWRLDLCSVGDPQFTRRRHYGLATLCVQSARTRTNRPSCVLCTHSVACPLRLAQCGVAECACTGWPLLFRERQTGTGDGDWRSCSPLSGVRSQTEEVECYWLTPRVLTSRHPVFR